MFWLKNMGSRLQEFQHKINNIFYDKTKTNIN